MLAEFSIWALDDPHLRDEMETIRSVLDDLGVDFHMGEMATTVQGSFNEINSWIFKCHQELTDKHSRLLIQVTFDDDRAS